MRIRHHILAASTLAIATTAVVTPNAVGARLLLGVQDDRMVHPGENVDTRMALVAGTKAKVVRVDLRWDLVAGSRPANARSDADPAYNWAQYDAIAAAAKKRRVNIIFTIWGTPQWAADPAAPLRGDLPAFGRRPKKPADAGNFAEAAAKRYSRRGVHMWEAWNEPNIPLFWQPQYRRVKGKWVADSPRAYSAVLKAMYRGIKRADRRAKVAGGVTAPAGDSNPQTCGFQPNCRVEPRAFLRALNAKGLRPPMDVVSHHPYPLRAPSNRNFAGASYIDLYNLAYYTKALNGTYLRRKPIWLTEFGIATRKVKEYRFATSERNQALWLRDAVRRVKKTPRVKVFVWYLLQDHPDWASGLYRQNGKAKPSMRAFRALAR